MSRTKGNPGRSAAFALLAAVAAMPAAAATGDGGRAPFQKYVASACGADHCEAVVVTVPKKRRLEIRGVSCTVQVLTPEKLYQFGFLRDLPGGGQQASYYAPTLTTFVGSYYKFVLNSTDLLNVNAGETLRVFADGNDKTKELVCNVAGEMVKVK